jgi:branched-chain amino acid aminotransferase
MDIPVYERNISLVEMYNADVVFTTGTMGELTPVREIDKRLIENRSKSGLFERLQAAFRNQTEAEGEPFG